MVEFEQAPSLPYLRYIGMNFPPNTPLAASNRI
jgi:hypothetical protein